MSSFRSLSSRISSNFLIVVNVLCIVLRRASVFRSLTYSPHVNNIVGACGILRSLIYPHPIFIFGFLK